MRTSGSNSPISLQEAGAVAVVSHTASLAPGAPSPSLLQLGRLRLSYSEAPYIGRVATSHGSQGGQGKVREIKGIVSEIG